MSEFRFLLSSAPRKTRRRSRSAEKPPDSERGAEKLVTRFCFLFVILFFSGSLLFLPGGGREKTLYYLFYYLSLRAANNGENPRRASRLPSRTAAQCDVYFF